MQNALVGRRVLITQATEFMGPALCEVFAEQGAQVVASADELVAPGAAERVVRDAGAIDVLVVNLALKARTTPAMEPPRCDEAGSKPHTSSEPSL